MVSGVQGQGYIKSFSPSETRGVFLEDGPGCFLRGQMSKNPRCGRGVLATRVFSTWFLNFRSHDFYHFELGGKTTIKGIS